MLETMVLGKPVVALAVGGLPELVDPEVTGMLVPPADPLALAKALGMLASHALLRERLGENARERALREFGSTPLTPWGAV